MIFMRGGATSPYNAEKLGQWIKNSGSGNFTYKDIIFIDHSVNDALSYSSPSLQLSLELGLEALIRRILQYSNGGDDYPTIILLEMFPFRGNKYNINYEDKPPNSNINYSSIYGPIKT